MVMFPFVRREHVVRKRAEPNPGASRKGGSLERRGYRYWGSKHAARRRSVAQSPVLGKDAIVTGADDVSQSLRSSRNHEERRMRKCPPRSVAAVLFVM